MLPGIPITAIRVVREGARGTKRDPRESWYWWLGGEVPELREIPALYARRYGQEHAYRYDKQDLLWTDPRLRTPERMLLRSRVVAAVRNELYLARPLAEAERRPWESSSTVASRPATTRQVRRAMARLIIAHVGTPARSPRPRGKSPGRTKGAIAPRATRHPVISKGEKAAA